MAAPGSRVPKKKSATDGPLPHLTSSRKDGQKAVWQLLMRVLKQTRQFPAQGADNRRGVDYKVIKWPKREPMKLKSCWRKLRKGFEGTISMS